MSGPGRDTRTIEVAEHVAHVLEQGGVRCALIGAMALAAHGYSRATEDVDLGTAVDPFTALAAARSELEQAGWSVAFAAPDVEDALGGVLTVTGANFDPVQVVNFFNPLRPRAHPGAEGVKRALRLPGGPALAIVDLAHLVAMKLFTGARRDELDVLELLERQPSLPAAELREVCARYGLSDELERALAEVRAGGKGPATAP